MPKGKKKIIILGSGPSLRLYKYKEGDTVWCPFSMLDEYTEKYINIFFGMHEWEKGKHKRLVDQNNYPLNDIVKSFNTSYFTNTVSYMIAYALHIGVDELEIYGVDMTGPREYISERGSVMYWIGRAESLGVGVYMASEIDKPSFLYGYESAKNLKNKLSMLKSWAFTEREGSVDQRLKDQYTGYLLALDTVEKEL